MERAQQIGGQVTVFLSVHHAFIQTQSVYNKGLYTVVLGKEYDPAYYIIVRRVPLSLSRGLIQLSGGKKGAFLSLVRGY